MKCHQYYGWIRKFHQPTDSLKSHRVSQKSKCFTRVKSITRSRSVCTIECCWFHDVHRIHVVCKVLGRCMIQYVFEGKLYRYVARKSQHPGTPALESHVPHTYRQGNIWKPELKVRLWTQKKLGIFIRFCHEEIFDCLVFSCANCSYRVLSLKFNINTTQIIGAIFSKTSFSDFQIPNASEFWGCKTPPFRSNMPEGTDLGSDPFSACLYPQRFWLVCQTLGLDGFIWHIYLSSFHKFQIGYVWSETTN